MPASDAIRNPIEDQLLTPQNSALVIIDYQPVQIKSIKSMDQSQLVQNIVRVVEIALLYKLPIVLSTVNVSNGTNAPTIPELRSLLPDAQAIDRTTINAWEDQNFLNAVNATQRKKLVMTALWTEACLTFPTLDALRDGFNVYPVVDAVGGTSVEAHETALRRVIQAGAKPISWVQLICELQRDWARTATAGRFAEILFQPTPAAAASN